MPTTKAALKLPVVASLPTTYTTADAGKQLFYQGYPWSWSGSAWVRNGGGAGSSVLTGAIQTGPVSGPPVAEFTQLCNDSRLLPGDKIVGWISYMQPPQKDLDELDMDEIAIWMGNVDVVGSFTLRMTCLTGLISGWFLIDYMILKAS